MVMIVELVGIITLVTLSLVLTDNDGIFLVYENILLTEREFIW